MSDTMDLKEFTDSGYLHEVNRCLLHPLGLAMAVEFDDDGNATGKVEIYDSREDPEGWLFGEDALDPSKAEAIAQAWHDRKLARAMLNGTMIQYRAGVAEVPMTVHSEDIGREMHRQETH